MKKKNIKIVFLFSRQYLSTSGSSNENLKGNCVNCVCEKIPKKNEKKSQNNEKIVTKCLILVLFNHNSNTKSLIKYFFCG